MKLLFLDIDGVLNHTGSNMYFWRTKFNRQGFMNDWETLCPIACNQLNHILEKVPELRVVISSTWRLFHPLEDFENKLEELCPAIKGRVIGRTPDLLIAARGTEIRQWLDTNGHSETPFVVIDDDLDMNDVKKDFVPVDPHTGLTWYHVSYILSRWNVKG